MAVPQGPFLAAVLLLVSSLPLCSSSSPACPQSCTCGRAALLNCSSAGLSSVPQHIRDSVTELDLSHNLLKSVTLHRPHHNLRRVWLGNNSIPHLSVCIGRNLDGQYLRDTYRSGPWNRRRCVSWAPTLQLLSVERNQLEQLPEGLEGIKSLQVLHLSFNRISTLQPGDLSHLQQLKELHLQHNLITSLHPQMFQDLAQLKVLDLSFNMLTSLHPLMHLTLHNIGTDVRLLGNRWRCDCRMHSLRRRMAFDRNRGLQVWSIVCASPTIFSGRDLLQLQDDDLNCLSAANIPDLHQDVTVYSGSEILLSCSAEDSMWWTPSGQTSVNQPEGGLLISDITERDTGLYVCVSKEKQVVSIFNLQISKIGGARRKPRSLSGTSQHIIQQGPSNRIGREINSKAGPITQSDLALAVCLSIFITFLIAFILGILARPCVDVFWKKVTKKKNSCETNTVVSVEQRQYDNEAFSSGEQPEVIGHHRERRVTFSTVDYREGSNVQYYDTVASGDQESINNIVTIECKATEAKNIKHTAEDSGSESSSHQSSSEDRLNDGRDHTSAGHRYSMEFEPIPDPDELEEKRSLSSSSSDSSLSEKEFKEDHTTPKYPKLTEDPVQQKADFSVATKIDGSQISTDGKNEMSGFNSEPWSPHTNNRNPTDPGDLKENEELFDFSDSVQSPSPRSGSMSDSFKKSKIPVVSTSEKQKRDSVSSSSSHISEDEPTFYTVNPDEHEDHFKKHAVRPDHSFSSDSSESDKEPDQHINKPETDKDTRVKITPKPRTKRHGVYWDTNQSETLDTNESNLDKKTQLHMSIAPPEVSRTIGHSAETKWPDREHKTDMKVSSPASDSSSSSDSGDETGHTKKQKPGKLGIASRPFQKAQTKSHHSIKAPTVDSNISSSNDSEEETPKKQEQGGVHMPIIPKRSSQKISHEHETGRPPIPPERPRSIKRDSDIKKPSSDSSSSSSSDSEDETRHKVQQSPGKLGIAPHPFQESPDPNAKWPTIDLQHIPHIKRRLDIKAPSIGSHTSSSSDSEEETIKHIKKQAQGGVHMPITPKRSSQKLSHEHETGRPPIPPERPRSIKKDSDIKKPSSDSSSSSSSDSEKETPKKQEQGGVHMPIIPKRSSQKISHEHETGRPPIPPERPRSIKRDSDIKKPLSDSSSSSSSDSEDETHHKVQQSPGKLGIAPHPFQESPDPNAKWPTIDLQYIPHIKRRLDIKAPSVGSHTSSSSDSEEETIKHIKKQEQGGVHMPIIPKRSSQKISHEHETGRPPIPPERPRSIKKDSDIKKPSSDSSSSSSSDSEKETPKKQEQGGVHMPIIPKRSSQKIGHEHETGRPPIPPERPRSIKRDSDIKKPLSDSSSSSSSDSEKETPKKQEQGGVHMPILPTRSPQKVSHQHERPRSIKKDSDIKKPSSDSSSSSSSDSEDETRHKVQQSPGKLGIAPHPFQESPDPNAKWPTIDLQHIPHIKRRLDIKAPSIGSHTSSSSDSEEETIKHIKKQAQGGVHMPITPKRSSQKLSHEHETGRPPIPPERPRSIKKDSDIKKPSSDSSSSSSSDSEKETPKKQEQGGIHMPIIPKRSSQKISHEHETGRPPIPPERPRSIKRDSDIKKPLSDSSSSSSSDSEDEKCHKVQQSPGKLGIAPHPFQESPDPNAKWPTIDLQYIPHIKRRLDIKAPSVGSHTSSSSDSEEETIKHIKKQAQGGVHMPIIPQRSSQKISHEHETGRPPIPPERLRSIKRDSDIKKPSSDSSSSSSSDSEKETPKKQEQGGVHMPIIPKRSSQKISHEHETGRPPIPPERPRSIKRDSDIKKPSSDSSSSSSSDSEDETRHKVQQSPGKLGIAPHPFQESPDPNAKWPTIDLQYIPHIKRRLDIKVPSVGSHTSSSSDSEKETPKKQEQGGVHMPILPTRSPQKVSHQHERPRSIKKDSDIKKPSSDSSSSSSSDSEDETCHKVQQSPGKLGIAPHPFQESPDPNAKWPTIDLQHIPHIKRRLDIKAPSIGSHTSSSSDSEKETPKKQEQGGIHMPIIPKRSSQKISHEDETGRPPIPPERPRSIKRDSDIKKPSSDSSSSSSSGSEDETRHKVQQSPGKLGIAPHPFQESPDPNAKWPTIDLQYIPHIKRRLDIKVPSVGSHTSSSSDSEKETPKKQEQGGVHMPILPTRSPQKVSHQHERPRSIKKDSDIKKPSSDSSSSSSSDSEDETCHKVQQSPGKLGIAPHPFQESPDPNAKWPTIDLQHIPHIKRRLDIKAPSIGSHTSSSSDSEKETPKKQEQGGIHMPIIPKRSSQKISHEDETGRPPIPPERPRSIKRDSDIKKPSSDSSSSSSSGSEDETRHKVQQSPVKLGIAPHPFQESPDPNAKWPTIDLQYIPHIKRRLDIKAPSISSHTSSSDSEEETPKKQEQGGVQMPILPNRAPQKVSHQHERPRSIKKDSDIKKPSSDSSSSSSSDSEDETRHKVQQSPGKLGIAPHPFQESPDPNAKWPTIDLQYIPHIKRRLDIKAPSIRSHTSSSSDSEEETTKHIKKQEQGGVQMPILPNRSPQKVSHQHEHPRSIKKDSDIKKPSSDSSSSSSSDSEDETCHKVQQSPGKLGIAPHPFQESRDPNVKWPTIDLQHIPHIKRRLDIKAPSIGSHTSSSSDSEKETPKKQEQGGIHMPIIPKRSSQKISHEHETGRPPISPERPRSIKRDSDFKKPSSDSSSSSSSDSEDETRHKVQQSPGMLGVAPHPFQESPDPNAKWPTIDLQYIPHIKRHLDIKAPSVGSHTSSSSDSEEDTPKKQEQGGVHMPVLPNRSPQKVNHEHECPRSIKKNSHIKKPSSDSSSSSSSDSEDETVHKVQQSPGKLVIAPHPFQENPDPNAKWPTIDLQHIPHIKRHLDIKAPSVGSYPSSSSDSEDETTKHLKKQELGGIYMPRQPTELPQTTNKYAKTQRPGIHFKHNTDIKAPSLSSSSSDSEDEKRGHTEKQKLGSTGFPFQQSQTKNHDPGYTSSSSDEQKERMEDLKNRPVTVKPDSRWLEMGLSNTPYVKKRLDIKALSPKSSSSSDESEGRTTDLPVKVDSNLRSPKSTLFNMPHSSKKDPNIKLEKYVIIKDDLGDKPKNNISTTPEINTELQSRWATMNLGISRFRKCLEITSPRHHPSKLPLSPPPDSPLSSAESETGRITNQKRMVVGMQEITHTQADSSLNLENKQVKPSDSSSSSSSSSSSEDEITENRVPPGMMYIDSPIAYKRSIIKTSSLPDNSFSPSTKNQIINVAQESERDGSTSLAPKRVSSMSFEHTVRRKIEQRHNTDVDIPPEIRWTGVGHYLSKFSTPAPKTGLNASSTAPQQVSPAKPEPPPLYSSSIKSDTKIKEDTWKSDLMPTHKFSSISTNSASSGPRGALYRLYNSPNTTYEAPSTVLEDRKERRGLSALKAMSSERKKWDTENFSESDGHSPQIDAGLYYLKSEPDIKPLPKQPATQLYLPSASLDKRRATDLLYGVPHYRSHDIKPPQVAPPPVPPTLKPDEAVGLTWKSPQGSKKQGLEGNRSYQQQTQNTEEIGSPSLASEYPPIYLNSSNITHV